VPSDTFGAVGVCVVNSDCDGPVDGADTINVALALVSPAEDAVTLAVPAVVGVTLDMARPLDGVTGDGGLTEPDTPLRENVTGFVALVTVLPLAS
jgi:hypothetical protein